MQLELHKHDLSKSVHVKFNYSSLKWGPFKTKVTDYKNDDIENVLGFFYNDAMMYKNVVDSLPIDDSLKYESGFSLFKHKIPMWIFLISLLFFVVWSWKQNLSLIPLLGLVCCLYMMAELSVWNWIYFTCWLLIGLTIYFGFSIKNSKLNKLKA